MRKFRIPQFDIVAHRYIFFGISIAIILAGVVSFFIQGFNWGIDFTGGTEIELNIGRQFDNQQLSLFIEKQVGKAPQVSKNQQEPTHAIIKTVAFSDSIQRQTLYDALAKQYKIKDMNKAVISSSNFSATVGKQLQQQTIMAAVVALVLILLYVTFRFEFNFGFAAIMSLVHDILIMVAIYTIFRVPMTSDFIAVVLTILGFSVNDTIVVFDRVRANLKHRKKGETYAMLANKSIWQTMSRSINTVFCVLIAITFLLIFGVSAIREFAFPLFIGIISGSYSTIFLAVPITAMTRKEKKA